MMTSINMTLESFDDWEILSIDGEVAIEGHRIENKDMIRVLREKLKSVGVDLSLEYVFVDSFGAIQRKEWE